MSDDTKDNEDNTPTNGDDLSEGGESLGEARADLVASLEKNKIQKALKATSDHFARNEKFYIGLLVGVSVTALAVIVSTKKTQIINIVKPVANAIAEGGHATSHATSFGGNAHKLVKRLEDGKIFETVKEAAKEAGVSPSAMSKHLNGHAGADDVRGMTFKIIGLGTK